MKEVRAYIKDHKLSATTLALHKIEGLTGMTVSDVRGIGRGMRAHDHRRGEEIADHLPRVRIEVFCRDELVPDVIQAIQKAAHTGLRGDGKIYVLDVQEAVRISSGEQGESAV